MTTEQKVFEFHVSAEISVSADITVLAGSQQEADAKVREQLNLRNSRLINDLRASASEQIRKELRDTDFNIEISETYDLDKPEQ